MEMPSSSSVELQTDNEVTEMIVQESTADDSNADLSVDQAGSDMETSINEALNNMFVPITDVVPPQGTSPPAVEQQQAEPTPEPNNTVEVMNSSNDSDADPGLPIVVPTSTPAEPSADVGAAAASSSEPTGMFRSRFSVNQIRALSRISIQLMHVLILIMTR
jgi:hypothetical protein